MLAPADAETPMISMSASARIVDPANPPQKELVARTYKGKVYPTHGVANPDSLRVAATGVGKGAAAVAG